MVEDEPLLADAIAEWLPGDAHAADVVHDGGAALEPIGGTTTTWWCSTRSPTRRGVGSDSAAALLITAGDYIDRRAARGTRTLPRETS